MPFGSLIPAPIILLLFNPIFNWLKKFKFLNWFTGFIENRLQKNTPKIEKYKEIGLIIFIGIPLPTTGVWTGSAVAAVLGLDMKKSLFLCFIRSLNFSNHSHSAVFLCSGNTRKYRYRYRKFRG